MLKKHIRSFMDLIYPRHCSGCKKPLKNTAAVENVICGNCWTSIKKNRPPFCSRCGRYIDYKTTKTKICNSCLKKELHFDRAFSACLYEGAVKELIHRFKYKGEDNLSIVLTSLLIDFIREFNLPPLEFFDMLIPIPLHKNKLREREFNQAQLIAQNLSNAFEIGIATDNLIRQRNTSTQTELPTDMRFANVLDSFTVRDPDKIKDKMVILVDDVLTSGATCSEAAKALKTNGARTVFALTIAS